LRPQKVAAVCLSQNNPNGGELQSITPQPLTACPPVPFNVNGAPFTNHLYALVTQQTRGQLAVVDLTAGVVVDEDRSTPGINFIPVGADPSDVAVAPDIDPTLTFVASRDPNSFAIYGIPNSRLLGDSVITRESAPLTLPDLRVCRLPQPPIALGIVTLPPGTPGTPSAGTPAYAVVAVLAPWAGAPSRIVSVDPTPFSPTSAAPLPRGILQECTLLGAPTTLVGAGAVPQTWTSGVAWPDGVVYADAAAASTVPACVSSSGGTDGGPATAFGTSFDAGPFVAPLSAPQPSSIAVRDDAPVAYIGDGVLPLIHVVDFSGGGAPVETGQFFPTSVINPSTAVPVAGLALSPVTSDHRRYLYAIDGNDGSLMIFDATSPTPPPVPETPLVRPHPELNPFERLDRISFSAPVAAITFATHDWPLVPPGSTSPSALTGLKCNPNPNALADGGTSFVDGGLGGFYRADHASTIQTLSTGATVTSFPARLRGVFAFATLSDGNMVTVDVDDWDAPCRRPDPMFDAGTLVTGLAAFGQPGVLALPEPAPSGPDDLDPYHAPLTSDPPTYNVTGVSEEAFFPVSAPNRIRSSFLLRNDPTTGKHLPYVVTVPQLVDSTGAPFASPNGAPIILPTALAAGFVDPTYTNNPTSSDPLAVTTPAPSLQSAAGQDVDAGLLFPGPATGAGVRVSFDDPTAAIDQDWTVTFEGVLPTATDIVADMSTPDGFQTITLQPGLPGDAGAPADAGADAGAPAEAGAPALQSNGARFCSRGIEDWTVGQSRIDALTANGSLMLPPDQKSFTADYIEIIDDLVAINDPYWKSAPVGGDCWQGVGDDKFLDPTPGEMVSSDRATDRYHFCFAKYGPSTQADTTPSRDFPILSATDNAIVVGRFGFPDGQPELTTNRTIAGQSPTNVTSLKAAMCCFHSQVNFKVRAGGEWLTAGSTLGLLHHDGVVIPATGACGVRCDDPTRSLLNARAFEVQSPPAACAGMPPQGMVAALGRDSPFAMRNPMFSFVMWNGCGRTVARTPRDAQWRFSLRGGFTPITVPLGGPNSVPVAPQSMLYIQPFGQMAIVDGAQQGLVLIDLNTLAQAHNPYF
jgi:hypothetical protein